MAERAVFRRVDGEPMEIVHGMSIGRGFTGTTWFGEPGSGHKDALIGPGAKLVAIGRHVLAGQRDNWIAMQLGCGHELVAKVRRLVGHAGDTLARKRKLRASAMRRHRARHPEATRARSRKDCRAYRARNLEKERARSRAYRARNLEKERARSRAAYSARMQRHALQQAG